MVDFVRIKVKAGKGGSGAVSFQVLGRRKRSKGPPDGGDGGDGGSVYLQVRGDLNTLLPYRYKKDFKAAVGQHGGRNHRKGKVGEEMFLAVPVGTKVSDETGRLVADLTKPGERVMVVKGGKGGRGNSHIKKSEFRNQNSESTIRNSKFDMWRWHEEGEEGQEVELTLELKLLADVGLIGLPNAGKSTLLSKLTAANPKIGDYPFTTISPNLGVMGHKSKEIVIADIPGLIEGSSKGKGLGDLFLRHIERTGLLVHLISAETENPIESLEMVNYELAVHSKELIGKTQVVCLSKIDIVPDKDIQNKIDQFKKKKVEVIQISAVTGEGLVKLKDEIIKRI